MDPITLHALAALMQLHGAGATLVSDNKGVDKLLGAVRTQLESKTPVQLASMTIYGGTHGGSYGKSHGKTVYVRTYAKVVNGPPPHNPRGPGITHGGGHSKR